jgi:hypothetical protein
MPGHVPGRNKKPTKEATMRHTPWVAAAILLATVSTNALAVPTTGSYRPGDLSPLQFVQEKQQKSETVKEKVKRIWKEWTGYKFDVGCPAFPIQLTHATCTETGKNREEARAKCQSRNAFCLVTDAKR